MEKPADKSEDNVPKPFTPKLKAKSSPRPAITKADQANYKRANKTAYKPAPR